MGTGDWILVSLAEPGLGTGGRASAPRRDGAALDSTFQRSTALARTTCPTPRSPVPSPQSPAPNRSGITLLEVLISIFVLAVGLLSIASLIPVASFQVQRSHIDDTKALVGQQAIRDLRNHGFLRPDYWCYDAFGNSPLVNTRNSSLPFGVLLLPNNPPAPRSGQNRDNGFGFAFPPIAIDPYMIRRFPPPANRAADFALATAVPAYNGERIEMYRVTCATALQAAADQVCQSLDDLVFDTSSGGPDSLPTGGFNNPAGVHTKRSFQGQFSWLATLVPVYGDPLAPAGTMFPSGIPVSRNAMILSTVVFNQRPTAVAPGTVLNGANVSGERAAQATFSGTGFPNAATRPSQGIGAGELQISELNPSATLDQANIDLAVKPGEWIMLGTMIADPNAPTQSRNSTGLPQRPFFRWYRVVNVGPIMQSVGLSTNDNRSGAFARDLTVTGADWQMATVVPTVSQKDSKTYPQFFAFIYDGAVAVYERTVRLEGTSMWSN